jgi:hypothetical protein
MAAPLPADVKALLKQFRLREPDWYIGSMDGAFALATDDLWATRSSDEAPPARTPAPVPARAPRADG